MKYKVGDEVKIRKGSLAGNIYTISHIETCGHIELSDLPYVFFDYELEPVVPTLAEIKEKKLTCVVHAKTKREADMLFKAVDSYDHNGKTWASWWDVYKEKTCYRTDLGEVVAYGCMDNYIEDGEKVIEFSDLVATDGTISIHNLQTDALSAWATNVQLYKETVFNGLSQVLKRATEVYSSTKEEKNLKFTFYTVEGYRMDKSNNTRIPTMTTEVLINGKDYQYGGSATCDKTDYEEREGLLNAIANAVCGGNFDREYEKFLANKKHKYDESCKCKICGRNYYEDEKTGKRTPFTPEDARKHEEWHEQNKKNKRERYLLRRRAKEIAFEEAAQKMAKEMMNEKK